jgi:hypothetical protein
MIAQPQHQLITPQEYLEGEEQQPIKSASPKRLLD